MRTCRRCREAKAGDQFYWLQRRGAPKKYPSSYCKPCSRAISRCYDRAHREKRTQQSLEWRTANRDAYRAKSRERREANPRAVLAEKLRAYGLTLDEWPLSGSKYCPGRTPNPCCTVRIEGRALRRSRGRGPRRVGILWWGDPCKLRIARPAPPSSRLRT